MNPGLFEESRHQPAARSFPYLDRNLAFENSKAIVKLAGKLTIPEENRHSLR